MTNVSKSKIGNLMDRSDIRWRNQKIIWGQYH